MAAGDHEQTLGQDHIYLEFHKLAWPTQRERNGTTRATPTQRISWDAPSGAPAASSTDISQPSSRKNAAQPYWAVDTTTQGGGDAPVDVRQSTLHILPARLITHRQSHLELGVESQMRLTTASHSHSKGNQGTRTGRSVERLRIEPGTRRSDEFVGTYVENCGHSTRCPLRTRPTQPAFEQQFEALSFLHCALSHVWGGLVPVRRQVAVFFLSFGVVVGNRALVVESRG